MVSPHRDSLQGQRFCHQLQPSSPSSPLPTQGPLAALGHSSRGAAGIPSALHGRETHQPPAPSMWQSRCHPTVPALVSQEGFLSCPGSSQSGGAGVFINRDVSLHHWGQAPSRAEVPAARWEPGRGSAEPVSARAGVNTSCPRADGSSHIRAPGRYRRAFLTNKAPPHAGLERFWLSWKKGMLSPCWTARAIFRPP